MVDAILVLAQWVGYLIGTYLFQKRRWHPKLLIGIGASISLGGVFASSYTTSVTPYLIFYCLMNGLGCGMNYILPLICSWEWFPDNKGIVTGITLAGYGFGSFIFTHISTKLVNPNNDYPIKNPNSDIDFFGPEVADRVPYMIRTLVYIWAGLVFISLLLISRKP